VYKLPVTVTNPKGFAYVRILPALRAGGQGVSVPNRLSPFCKNYTFRVQITGDCHQSERFCLRSHLARPAGGRPESVCP